MRKSARPKEVVEYLLGKGFLFKRQRGSHAIYQHSDGRWTVVPMHNRDLPIGTLHGIFKYAGLPISEF